MKITLCEGKECCPTVEILEDSVILSDNDAEFILFAEEWNELKNRIMCGEL